MTFDLSQAMHSPDTESLVPDAIIRVVHADGTADIDLGGGRTIENCPALTSYALVVGDVVSIIRRDRVQWLILGARSSSTATTVGVGRSWGIAYDVNPGLVVSPANPQVINAAVTRSYRLTSGWGTAVVYQGNSANKQYWKGLYFYGSGPFAPIVGRTCTRLRLRVHRTATDGAAGAVAQWVAAHLHEAQPVTEPVWTTGAKNVGTVVRNTATDLDLPVEWGQGLIDGSVKGFGHRYTGSADYSAAVDLASDSLSGRLTIDWV